jgi:hypothetical protein
MFLATRQHFSNTCFFSIYLAVDTIFQSSVSYQDLLDRELIVSRKLLNQGFLVVSWSNHSKYSDRYHD